MAPCKVINIPTGEWFAFYSSDNSNAQLFINRGSSIRLELRMRPWAGTWFYIYATKEGSTVSEGDVYNYEWLSLGFPLGLDNKSIIQNASDFVPYINYLNNPTGLQILRGVRTGNSNFVELQPASGDYAVELSIPKPINKLNLPVALRVKGLNSRWSAGLLQEQGYNKGNYGSGSNRYRALGYDSKGNVYVPMYVDYAEVTKDLIGNPVVAGTEGRNLFIQVTHMNENPQLWHVSVNNPTDSSITTTLRKVMNLPGLNFTQQNITIPAGGYLVLE